MISLAAVAIAIMPGAHRALARDIRALAALLQRRADDDIVDLAGLNAGAPHRLGDGVPGERLRLSVIEGAAIGSADRRAGGGDNDGAAHELSPVSSYSAAACDSPAKIIDMMKSRLVEACWTSYPTGLPSSPRSRLTSGSSSRVRFAGDGLSSI